MWIWNHYETSNIWMWIQGQQLSRFLAIKQLLNHNQTIIKLWQQLSRFLALTEGNRSHQQNNDDTKGILLLLLHEPMATEASYNTTMTLTSILLLLLHEPRATEASNKTTTTFTNIPLLFLHEPRAQKPATKQPRHQGHSTLAFETCLELSKSCLRFQP